MAKLIFLFVCMSLALFGSSQSASFECKYYVGKWGYLGTIYYCDVQNVVRITSPDAAQIESITGDHKPGYNNDNVEVFSVIKGQIHYFPRGINKFFKNLKGIQIYSPAMQELHQSDLKPFPKLGHLNIHSSQLEILEEDLFEFNPNLEWIYFNRNKISHIHPNVFDKLTKLKNLYLEYNPCINFAAQNSEIGLVSLIKKVRAQCRNSNYSNLEQKVKNLQIESKNLNSEDLKEKLEKLEKEIKNSKFPNFFQQKLQDLKAVKVSEEPTTTITTVIDELVKTSTTTTTKASTEPEDISFGTCSALESKVDEISTDLKALSANGTCCAYNNKDSDQCMAFKDDLRSQAEALDTKLEIFNENVQNSRTASLREIKNLRNEVKTDHAGILTALRLRTDKIEKKIGKIEENLTKIIKALHIED